MTKTRAHIRVSVVHDVRETNPFAVIDDAQTVSEHWHDSESSLGDPIAGMRTIPADRCRENRTMTLLRLGVLPTQRGSSVSGPGAGGERSERPPPCSSRPAWRARWRGGC